MTDYSGCNTMQSVIVPWTPAQLENLLQLAWLPHVACHALIRLVAHLTITVEFFIFFKCCRWKR